MLKRSVIVFFLFFYINQFSQNHVYDNESELQKPIIFLKDLVSTDKVEFGGTFMPDGNTFYFIKSNADWGQPKSKFEIHEISFSEGKWNEPKPAFFSSKYSDAYPHVSADGRTIFFSSNRPLNNGGEKNDSDIWFVRKTEKGWGEPENLSVVNSSAEEMSPYTAVNGNLYFVSTRKGGYGLGDIYASKFENGKYQQPANIGAEVNGKSGEWNLCISPDEKYIIFESSGRDDALSPFGDLYITYENNGEWSKPENIKLLNTTGSDLTPSISPNGKYLFYSSSNFLKNKNVDIYYIELNEIVKGSF